MKRLALSCLVLAGSLHPDEVFERCGFTMPDGEFETFAEVYELKR